jgi:hypothetical protein
LNVDYSTADQEINDFPTTLDRGLPPIPALPDLRPERNNGIASTSYWQRVDSGRPPEYWTWNLDIQQQLTASSVLTMGYTGTRGVHLNAGLVNINQIDPKYLTTLGPTLLRSNINSQAARDANIPIPYTGFNGTVQQALQPFPQFRSIETYRAGGDKSGNSSYHAMTIKFDKRYGSGMTMIGSYVFSKFFSDSDNANQVNTPALDQYNRKLEKGLSTDDQSHNAKLGFSYELPVGKGKHYALRGAADKILGGWSFAGFLQYSSGFPMAVAPGINPPIYPLTGANRVFVSSYDNWRASVAGAKFDPFKDRWFNSSAFQQVPREFLDSRLGNATRNNPKLRTPAILNEDISLQKMFAFTEKVRMEFRIEAFNLANRVRWGAPDSTATSANFGLVRSQANNPRQMQMGLKVEF